MLPRRSERLQWARPWREEKKKDDVVYCYGCCTGQFPEAFPGIACSSGQNMALVLGSPSWPQTSSVHWHPVEVCVVTPLKAPVLKQIGWAAPWWGCCVENFSEEFIRSVERKLVDTMSRIYVIFSTLWNFSQYSSLWSHVHLSSVLTEYISRYFCHQILVYGEWHGIWCLVYLLYLPAWQRQTCLTLAQNLANRNLLFRVEQAEMMWRLK